MAKSIFKNIKIRGIAAAVPKNKVDCIRDHEFLPEDERRKIVELTGVPEYRKTPPEICSSDLCEASAKALLKGLDVDPASIDAVVFSTMTADYRAPSTACILQHKLSLPTSAVAFDVNMGCSGYVVGLFNACALIQGGGLKRVLLLSGDTQTKLCYEKDKNVVFLLGDGGTATLLESVESSDDIKIELMTDGSRFQNLYVPAGGCRRPSTASTREIKKESDGGLRSEEHLYMNGMEIFKFSATDVVKSLQGYMESEKINSEDIDYLILHQANKFMNDKIAKKLKFPPEKVLYSINKYGNTAAASIPLTIVHNFGRMDAKKSRCLLSGFGVGLSWGIVDIVLDRIYSLPVIEI